MPDHETCTKLEVNQAVTNQRMNTLVEYMQDEFKEINLKINKLIYAVIALCFLVLGGDEGLKIIANVLK